MSPYKCSLLIKLKFCSLSVTSISVWFAAYRNQARRERSCIKVRESAKFCCQAKVLFCRNATNVCSVFEDSLLLLSSLLLWRIYHRRFISDTSRKKNPCWTRESLSGDTAAGKHTSGPLDANIWSCFWLWFGCLAASPYFLVSAFYFHLLVVIFKNAAGFLLRGEKILKVHFIIL